MTLALNGNRNRNLAPDGKCLTYERAIERRTKQTCSVLRARNIRQLISFINYNEIYKQLTDCGQCPKSPTVSNLGRTISDSSQLLGGLDKWRSTGPSVLLVAQSRLSPNEADRVKTDFCFETSSSIIRIIFSLAIIPALSNKARKSNPNCPPSALLNDSVSEQFASLNRRTTLELGPIRTRATVTKQSERESLSANMLASGHAEADWAETRAEEATVEFGGCKYFPRQ